MRILTRAQQEEARRDRGCSPNCCCVPCCTDNVVAEITEKGHNPYDVDPQMLKTRLLMAAKTRKAARVRGTGATRASRPSRRGAPPSDKQLDLLGRLFRERQIDSKPLAQTLALQTYDENFDGRAASVLIDYLLKQPKSLPPQFLRPQGQPEDYLLEDRMYGHAGRVYRVQRSQDSGRLYAVEQLPEGGSEYAPGTIRLLEPKDLLSLEQAQAWGREHVRCCQCGAALTNPVSIEAGIGPVCAGRFRA